MDDVLVVGAGPAGLAIAAALGQAGLKVSLLAPTAPTAPWQPTYGTWKDELEAPGLGHLLHPLWSEVTVYVQQKMLRLPRAYGLFDNPRLQAHLLTAGEQHGVTWQRGLAGQVEHTPTHARVILKTGGERLARLVVDASGHYPALLRRPPGRPLAAQVAYGILGTFSQPPVGPGEMVLMDYRTAHLPPAARQEPATFLYAMDLGQGRYFVEETSLASDPPLPYARLEQRLHQRLAYQELQVQQVLHIERVNFPMNPPLPYLDQPILGYGAAAGMVHPASGYQVGAALRRAPELAQATARALDQPGATPAGAARAGWQALWPAHLRRKRSLYLLGLHTLLDFDSDTLQSFFAAFFRLPLPLWSGYLSNTLTTRQLLPAMLRLFRLAPPEVRRQLIAAAGRQAGLLREIVRP